MSLLKRRWWVGLLLICLAAPVFLRVSAQDTNLLQDAGFEGNYVGRGRPNLNTPAAWNIWLATSPHNYDWQNLADKVTAFPQNAGAEVHSGAHSLNLNDGYATYTAAIYQQVSVQPNQNYTGSIWARLKTCNIGKDSDNCGSAVESGAYVRLGIDPTGGTDPNSGAIVWSGNIMPHDSWQQATVSATATGGTITLFALRHPAVALRPQQCLVRRRLADRRRRGWRSRRRGYGRADRASGSNGIRRLRPAAPRRRIDCSHRPDRRYHDRHFVGLRRLHRRHRRLEQLAQLALYLRRAGTADQTGRQRHLQYQPIGIERQSVLAGRPRLAEPQSRSHPRRHVA